MRDLLLLPDTRARSILAVLLHAFEIKQYFILA